MKNKKSHYEDRQKSHISQQICMLIGRYYPVIGGSEKQLQGLVKELLKKHVRSFIVTERWGQDQLIYDNIDGTPVYRLSLVKPGWLRNLSNILFTCIFLLIKRNKFNIIHTHSNAALGTLGVFIGKILRKKVIVKIATAGTIPKLKKIFPGNILLYILKKADIVISISQEITKELQSINLPDFKIKNIPNGVDTEQFFPLSHEENIQLKEKLNLHMKKPLVLFAGRLVYRKGVDILLKAWKNVILECTNMSLLIAGSGSHQHDSVEKELKQYVKENNLQSSVSFLGTVENISEYLQVSDIFVLPSRKEGMPNVILEAMSCGLAVIATNIGGITDLISNKNGLLCPRDNPAVISEKILFLGRNREFTYKLGENARKTIENNFSLNNICDDFIHLYCNLNKKIL